jgi:hypothetical protein
LRIEFSSAITSSFIVLAGTFATSLIILAGPFAELLSRFARTVNAFSSGISDIAA